MSQQSVKNTGLVILVLLLLGGGLVVLWHSYLSQPEHWPINHLQVEGKWKHLDQAQIRQQVSQQVQGGFFNVDMVAIRQALLNQPWVADASVRRIWPDALSIYLREQQPVARWQMLDGTTALINARGVIFHPEVRSGMGDLPLLYGDPDVASHAVRFYQAIQTEAARHQLQVAGLGANQRQEWQVRFANGLVLMLGQQAQQSWADFRQIYQRLTDYGKPKRIDMRYASGVAVLWRNDSDRSILVDPTEGKG